MKKKILPLVLLAVALKMHGQVGVNTTTPQATFDIVGVPATVTAADGLIAPRLTRAQLIAKTGYGSNQQGAIVYVTDSSGTVSSSTLKVTGAGYYYFDGTIWQAIGGTPVVPTEPWNVQGGTTPSVSNTDNIYQIGAVAIKKQTGITGVDLDVLGSIRGGNASIINDSAGDPITVGTNNIVVGNASTGGGASSATFGDSNINKGDFSIVAGGGNAWNGNKVTGGQASAVFGHHNTVGHNISLVAGYGNVLTDASGNAGTNFAFGDSNIINGNYSWNAAIGRNNNITTTKAFVVGESNLASNSLQAVFGTFNFDYPASAFAVGNGANNGARSNSFAITGAGNTAWVAINSGNAAPTAASTATKLKVYGDTEVTTKLGIGAFTTAPTNALHVKAAADPVKLEGLQADATASNLVVVDGTGVLKTISKTAVGAPIWNIQATANPAAAVADNVYHTGNTAIGTLPTDPARTEKLYVKGNTSLDAQNFAGTRAGILDMNDSSYYNSIYEKPANTNNGEGLAKSRVYNMLSYYNTDSAPVAEIFSGNDSNKVGGKISMFSSTGQKASGLGWVDLYAFSYTSATVGKNTYLGLDDDGVKIGVIRAPNNDIQYSGTNGVTTSTANGMVTDTYALPKTLPTTGQVLMFDTATGGGASATVVKTKWATPAAGASSIWNVQATTTAATTLSDNVYHTGKVAIGTASGDALATSMLYVKGGDIETTGKFISGSSVYADYVFEKYFTGDSKINAKYHFTPLSEVKDFVAKNHHLPGVTPIADVTKADGSYRVDLTQLSMQQLEKLEELYLHVIEQKETIDTQEKEIQQQNIRIKALEDKLEKLLK